MDPNTTTAAPARIQSSIRSFFQSKTNAPAPLTVPLVAQSAPQNQISQQTSQTQSTSNAKKNKPLHPRAKISPIEPDHIQPLRRINSLLLPINYPDSFYHKILEPSPVSLSRVILWQDAQSKETKVIGGLVCRLDPSLAVGSGPATPQIIDGSYDVYLQSLVLLSPYREKGLASAALDSVIEAATRSDDIRIRALYAHVWTENTEALEWYAARSFQKDEMVVNGYYKRLKPDTAWILRRNLMPSDHLAQNVRPQQTVPAPTAVQPPKSTAPPAIAEPRPTNLAHTASFQDRRPDMEWNDLPEDVLGGSLLKAPAPRSGEGSSASSRSTSRSGQGRKKVRAYPAAAFGS
jgi:ribosomal protein S18 acetylase RimI-like enzyme